MIGIIDLVHVRDGVMDPETLLVDREVFHPIGRMEIPAGYCRTRDHFDMPRP